MDCVMTMSVNSINPFLTGSRNHPCGKCDYISLREVQCGTSLQLGLSLRPQFVCCLMPTNNLDVQIMSEEAYGGGICVFSSSAFEAEREPIANDLMMHNMGDSMY